MAGCYFISFFLIIFFNIHLIFLLQEKKFLLERNGPHIARISIFEVCNELNSSVQNVHFFSFLCIFLKQNEKISGRRGLIFIMHLYMKEKHEGITNS